MGEEPFSDALFCPFLLYPGELGLFYCIKNHVFVFLGQTMIYMMYTLIFSVMGAVSQSHRRDVRSTFIKYQDRVSLPIKNMQIGLNDMDKIKYHNTFYQTPGYKY